MESVLSSDGVRIAFQRSGGGRPLVLVHGSTADHSRWATILPDLARHFTVLAMDRRGRGASGDSAPYDIRREFDDVAAVLAAAGPRANLLGHSFGALCAMEAALRAINLRRLILYEPAFPVDGNRLYPAGSRARFEALVATGDRDKLLTTYFRELAQMPEAELAALKADPSWSGRLAAAHTLVREMDEDDYLFEPARFANLTAPTLLLTGERSPAMLVAPSRRLAAALPDSRLVVLPGQAHIAMTTAPALFLRAVLDFLDS